MGEPIPYAAPYSAAPPPGMQLARAMMSQSVPMSMVQQAPVGGGIMQAGFHQAGAGSGIVPAGGIAPPGMNALHPMAPIGVPPMPGLMPPGGGLPGAGLPGAMTPAMPMPGIPGSEGVVQTSGHPFPKIPNVVAAQGAITGPGGQRFPTQRTEVRFVAPSGMRVSWPGGPTESQIVVPGRYNFLQGAIYRLKLAEIPGRPGVDLYPTLEVVPSNLKTDSYLAHSAVPVYFTDEDFDQVLGGNFLVKVIYLPYPQYADAAIAGGPDEIVSTRLEPGVDPIAEACKRGSILLIIRLGNIDLEAPNTPAMDAPNPYAAPPGCPPGMMGMGMPGMGMPGMGMPGMGMPGALGLGMPAGVPVSMAPTPDIPRPPIVPDGPMAGSVFQPAAPARPEANDVRPVGDRLGR